MTRPPKKLHQGEDLPIAQATGLREGCCVPPGGFQNEDWFYLNHAVRSNQGQVCTQDCFRANMLLQLANVENWVDIGSIRQEQLIRHATNFLDDPKGSIVFALELNVCTQAESIEAIQLHF